jgi:hypothetical protein
MASAQTHGFKATFTFDETTSRHLADAAVRLGKPKSEIVRDAINDYHSRLDRLTDEERDRMLKVIDELGPRIAPRPRAEIDRELAEIRRARRRWGQRGQSRR